MTSFEDKKATWRQHKACLAVFPVQQRVLLWQQQGQARAGQGAGVQHDLRRRQDAHLWRHMEGFCVQDRYNERRLTTLCQGPGLQ